jgi:peptidoglycan/xylan/chitin deacetylase (PgdA/CDA1 family)
MNRQRQKVKNSWIVFIVFALIFSGCASNRNVPTYKRQIFQSKDFVVLVTEKGDTSRSLARTFLGSEAKYWQIEEFNHVSKIKPGQTITIPLNNYNPVGVDSKGYQKVPVLCYHRFDDHHVKLSVGAKKLREQMQYLKDNGYHVIRLRQLIGYLNREHGLPKKSVVITIDDGYRTTYETAFPILKEFNFPATVFLYTDFMGGRDALNWKQIKNMQASGLIDFQPHSKSHPNMSIKMPDETDEAYEARIQQEIKNPSSKIERILHAQLHTFAYPYGDTNDFVIDKLIENDYMLGVTVQPGGNGAFAYPYMLRRTMIFGDFTEADFAEALETYEQVARN